MPFIDVKVMEGVLSTETKQSIAKGITEVFADAVGESVRGVTSIVIQDVASGQWMLGCNTLTTEGVKQLLG